MFYHQRFYSYIQKIKNDAFTHSKLYFNRKTDTLLFLNTLCYILLIHQKYEGALKFENDFYIK